MKKQKINILSFLIIIYLLSITNFLLPNSTNVIASENRNLSEKPILSKENLFSGEYFRKYDDYFADNFIFRKFFIDFSNKMKHAKGINNQDAAEIIVFGGLNVADNFNDLENEENVNTPNETKENNKDAIIDEELVEGTAFGKILIVGNAAMEIHSYNEEAIKNYANSINYISENVSENVKTYSLLVPTQIEFIKKNMYKDISYSQKECTDIVNKNFNSLVETVDVYKALEEHSNEYIYFRTDHHWTPLGAYYAYREFIKSTGEEPLNIDQLEKTKLDGFLGTLYNITLSEKLSSNPDTVEVYTTKVNHDYWVYNKDEVYMGKAVDINYMDEKNKYSVYLCGDYPLGKIQTEIKNNRKIVVIKDSYANSFIPFLIPHYEEIYIVDPRMYEGNIFDLVQENEIDEILFLNYVLVNRYDGYSKLFMKIAGE